MTITLRFLVALLLLTGNAWATTTEPAATSEQSVLRQIQLLNQVPQEQLSDKADPGLSLVRGLYDVDAPDFLLLRRQLGKAEVRKTLNPSAKALLAGLISQRWDSYQLAGNLWLAAFRSPNEELRTKARHRLVDFIQPAHIPELIELLKSPTANPLAHEVLQEVTGQTLEPRSPVWRQWWIKNKDKADLIGHLLKDTSARVKGHPIPTFDVDRFWYLPAGLDDALTPYAERSRKEQAIITEWNQWANQDVKKYVEAWDGIKPALDRLAHQPDPRVGSFFESLLSSTGYGDYAAVVLAWRGNKDALPAVVSAYSAQPSVGRALARGSLGDKSALPDLLGMIERHKNPLAFGIMDDAARSHFQTLRTVGMIPAERAFELLAHKVFDFDSAASARDKKRGVKDAKRWLKENKDRLSLDPRRGYYVPSEQ